MQETGRSCSELSSLLKLSSSDDRCETMNLPSELLLRVCSTLSNVSLWSISKTSLWLDVRQFATSECFWKLRTEHLLKRELALECERECERECEQGWKDVYYYMLHPLKTIPNRTTIRVLLFLGRDLSEFDNRAIRHASVDGKLDVVRHLLRVPEVLHTELRTDYIGQSLINGHEEIVKLLVSHPSYNAEEDYYLLSIACSLGRIETVRFFLGRDCNPALFGKHLLRVAAIHNHIEVIRLLLEDNRMKPDNTETLPFRTACSNGNLRIALLLMNKHCIREIPMIILESPVLSTFCLSVFILLVVWCTLV